MFSTPVRDTSPRWLLMVASVFTAAWMLQACGGGSTDTPSAAPQPAPTALVCDETMKTAFKPDATTTVISVKSFKAGDSVALTGTPATPAPSMTPHDLCVVKLLVGPGNPGPATAPSTSPGIGIEVWLPASTVWDKRIQVLGTAGDGGMVGVKDAGTIASPAALARAITERTVSAQTDHGHEDSWGASFMNSDGGINRQGWEDASHRAVHETAVKIKALVKGFYGQGPDRSYLLGCSGAGRDGYASAQKHPEDFDGILIGAPAINWTQFIGGGLVYPQIVSQRDLGGNYLTAAQRALVGAAAVSACDANLNGKHDGYIVRAEGELSHRAD